MLLIFLDLILDFFRVLELSQHVQIIKDIGAERVPFHESHYQVQVSGSSGSGVKSISTST